MADLSKFLPLIDLVTHAGQETSEFKSARTAGLISMALFVLGIVGVIVDCSSSAFAGTHVGMWLGAASSIISAVVGVLSHGNYANGRTDLKSKALDLLKALSLAAAAAESAMADSSAPVAAAKPSTLPPPTAQ